MGYGFKGAGLAAFCLAVVFCACLPAVGQETHWDAASGDWSQDANWTAGEPAAGVDAYVGSAAGLSTAAVTIAQANEECRWLYLGDGVGKNGALTIEPGGSLTAEKIYLGRDGRGDLQQNGGSCTTEYLALGSRTGWEGGDGRFEMIDGNLDAKCIGVADAYATFGRFIQRGGRITTTKMSISSVNVFADVQLFDGTLINTGVLALDEFSSFKQHGGRHEVGQFSLGTTMTYEMGGGYLVVADFVALNGYSVYRQDDGNTHVLGDVTVRQAGDFFVHGGDLQVDGNMLVAEEQGMQPSLEFLSPGGKVALGGTFTMRGQVDFRCGVGVQLHLTGPGFVNELAEAAGADRFGDLAIVYEGGPGLVATCEAAGEDMGPDSNGFLGNFALGTLRVGGQDDVGVVQLADDFENTPGDVLPEAVYVAHLAVEPGCTLDLNGLNLYYLTGGVDPAGTVVLNGGSLIQVPEPLSLSLLFLGLPAVLRRRRK